MNHTIFFSWQSDLENKYNRSFIQDVLEKASKAFSKDKNFSINAVIDRDTYGLAGSPSIVESITDKIAKSDVFICDISIINASSNERPMPNPNVLYELGFASAILGWERIILIQNTAYGNVELLPFDLRGRRILQYKLDQTINNKSEEKNKLKQTLIEILKHALRHYKSDYISKEKIVWWGKWNIESKTKVRGGQLHISRVSSDAFFFNIKIFDGARSGDISGKAQIITPNSAYARINNIDNNYCEIIFRRRLEDGNWWINVEENEFCRNFCGLSATFEGSYKHETELAINNGYLDEIDLNEIERIAGKYLQPFLNNFQQINYYTENDYTILIGGVKGLYTIMESIVVFNNWGLIWCAFLDPNEDDVVVRYFSNIISKDLEKPKAIKEWLSNFSDKPLFENENNQQYDAFELSPLTPLTRGYKIRVQRTVLPPPNLL
ncbi:MAG: nucleotide-binding protein [Bacteroidota bacterium]|nr:nucleotide-binding protein [Bacteroidota bacterium]